MTIKVLDIGAWDDGTAMPWAGVPDVEVTNLPEGVFLGEEPRKNVPFYRTAYEGCSSLYKPEPSIVDIFSQISTDYNFKVVAEEKVETVELDSLGYTPDLIKMDIQGGEVGALMGGMDTFRHALVAQIEVNWLPLYTNGRYNASEIFELMDFYGYFVHKMIDCGGSPIKPFVTDKAYVPISQLLYSDVVFIKDWRELNAEQTEKLAVILFDIYKSYDMAIYLMNRVNPEKAAALFAYAKDMTQMTAITYKGEVR